MKKNLLIFFSLLFFFNMPVNAKSISDQKDEQFCLPKDISKGTGCVWQVSKRTKGLGALFDCIKRRWPSCKRW